MRHCLRFLSLCFIISAAVLGCSESKKNPQIKMLSHDFGVQQVSGVSAHDFAVDPDCDKNIAQALCVSDGDFGFDPECSNERVSPAQFEAVKQITQALPAYYKNVMCRLPRIQIQKNISSIAYVVKVEDAEDKMMGYLMGLRPEVLEREASGKDLFSWKEQLNFGLTHVEDAERTHDLQGPLLAENVSMPYGHSFSVIIHELSHVVDLVHEVNKVDQFGCSATKYDHIVTCDIPEDKFARFYWGKSKSVFMFDDPEADAKAAKEYAPWWVRKFPLVGKLCFYKCKETIPLAQMPAVYAELGKTNFTTSYSTQNEFEDFAEAATYHALDSIGVALNYKIHDAQGNVYFDGYKHYRSEYVREKREWLDRFFR